ncbi:MAG TPA: hypothetical protein VHZ51_13615 [Ktedonobacteraceae bacterium]|jgi:hypothetical protein|nr:hypothetical protein [Ktedonobacteraceae bacterium]
MPLTVHDLRYQPEQYYPVLYAYLHRNAQRYLGSLKYDAFEMDTVIGHVVEQLVRLGILGGGDLTPITAIDRLTDAQFYAFLSRSVRNKAIDRLRKRRLPVSTSAELEMPDAPEDDSPLDDAVAPAWGAVPFTTPEEITLHAASQQELRDILKHCIMHLGAAPHQLSAIVHELQEYGADELLQSVLDELHLAETGEQEAGQHMSQHKDHAHKKLRHCLQQQSTNLTVAIALRLTECKQHSTTNGAYSVDIQTLAQQDLSPQDVRVALEELVADGLLDWHGEDCVNLTTVQAKRLARFYKEE